MLEHRRPPEGAHRYMPVRAAAFRDAVDAAEVDPSRFTFVDMGCGKGAALILAIEAGFSRVIGVEFDGELAGICSENLRTSGTVRRSGARAEVVHADAAAYELPSEPLVLFLYNPFEGPPLQQVADNLERSLREAPRDVRVIYLFPLERHRFDACDELEVAASNTANGSPRSRPGDQYVIYRAVHASV